jgi:thiol-disulfide isomerase/thioredoxin
MAGRRLFFAFAFLLLASAIVSAGLLLLSPKHPRSHLEPTPQRVASSTQSANSDPDSVDPTARAIRAAFLDTAARLDNLKITFVERGDNTVREPGTPVVLKEIWIHGQSAQARMDWRENGNGENWWKGFQTHDKPLTSADLETLPGMKICVDMRRKLAWADSRLLPPGRFESKTLHSVSKSPHWPVGLFLPLVTINKPWSLPALEGWSPVVNTLAGRPLSAWRVLGDERVNDIDCVKVGIAQQDPVDFPLKRHVGNLTLNPIHIGWFSKTHGLMPVRIEQSVHYGFGGREYALQRQSDRLAWLVYEASDFLHTAGVWMPYSGRQETYTSDRDDDAPNQFDPDSLVDKLLADGALRWEDKLKLVTRREWRILSMEPIDPAVELWFDAQNGAEVHNVDTDERYVQGDPVASKKYADEAQAIRALHGKPAPEFPQGATWLNGQPLTWEALRGKVVILDFWAITCGACYNDLPELAQLHASRESNGLVIIGVHSSGADRQAIEKVLGEHDIRYPMCIDVPPPAGTLTWGDFASRFAVGAIPHAVAVDSRGIVLASATNRFDQVLAAAHEAVRHSTPPAP